MIPRKPLSMLSRLRNAVRHGLLLGCLAAMGLAAEQRVLPPAVELWGPRAEQLLVVQSADPDGTFRRQVAGAAFSSLDSRIASVDAKGTVQAVSDGSTRIAVRAPGGAAVEVPVTVRQAGAAFTWSFRNHVEAVLTKAGCNSGPCHGALAGKNGLKLSLRGYDPEWDHNMLTRHATGRRVSLQNPANSLMLLKPTLAIAHGGGKRFATDSPEYRILSEWIAAGAPGPRPDDPTVTALEAHPAAAVLKPGDEQQIVVRAGYSDGRREDVTRWVRYASSNETVLKVDDQGRVKVAGPGEAAVVLTFFNRVLYATFTVPFDRVVAPEVFSKSPRRNFIDDLVLDKLRRLNIPPSEQASDQEFIRRCHLDAAGTLPTPQRIRDFLADRDPEKRRKLVEELLASNEFIDYWSYRFSDLFLVNRDLLDAKGALAFYSWIRSNIRGNKPWDQTVREIITATGDSYEYGPANFYRAHRSSEERFEAVVSTFLGQRIGCAKCHNHPLEKWTQNDYYSAANFFSRVQYKDGAAPGDVSVLVSAQGDILHPRLGRAMAPRTLDGGTIDAASMEDRRVHFAKWLTSPGNKAFARAIVNRIWSYYTGRGIVDPPDDMRATNPPANEELLARLADDFIAHRFDLRHLMRTILNSGAYQRSSRTLPENKSDVSFYSHYTVRRLPAEVILDAISRVTGVADQFEGMPAGMRALQLMDTNTKSYFLDVFGRPKREAVCECERMQAPTVKQALNLLNGETINERLHSKASVVDRLLASGQPPDEVVRELYLIALSRFPTQPELTVAAGMLSRDADRREALEDVVWALISGREFLFNH